MRRAQEGLGSVSRALRHVFLFLKTTASIQTIRKKEKVDR
jgi:hypothetical protein